MVTIHNIAGSEIQRRSELLPGYAAFSLGAPKPWQWRWRHTTVLLGLTIGAAAYASLHGLLP